MDAYTAALGATWSRWPHAARSIRVNGVLWRRSSYLGEKRLVKLLKAVKHYRIAPRRGHAGSAATVPGTGRPCELLRQAGFNRISLGGSSPRTTSVSPGLGPIHT